MSWIASRATYWCTTLRSDRRRLSMVPPSAEIRLTRRLRVHAGDLAGSRLGRGRPKASVSMRGTWMLSRRSLLCQAIASAAGANCHDSRLGPWLTVA